MILRKKCLSLFLSLSLVLPNLAPIYSYAEEATSINREEQKIKSENSQKEKVSKQLDEKFDLNDVAGDYAAEQINKYKLQDNFEYAVKEVLNYYYDEDKKDEISSFENTIDSRANNLIKDYKEASQERSEDDSDLGYKSGQVIVEFKSNIDKNLKEDVANNLDGKIKELQNGDIGVIDISNSDTIDKALENYEDNYFIESVQPNFVYKSQSSKTSNTTSTNDKYSSRQYYLEKLKIYDAWDYLKDFKTSKVKVAVIDTGLDVNHKDIKDNLYLGVDAENNYTELTRDHWHHGTHVSGIIAASTNNSIGVAGIGNNMVDLMAINVFFGEGSDTEAYTTDIIKGYNYAVKNGAKVINMSLGRLVDDNDYDDIDKQYDSILEKAINEAYDKGIVTVCAAGNESSSMKSYPSDFEACISVINIDKSNQKAYDSNYGTKKDISAYGVDIYSTVPGDKYRYESGTSMAAPIVSGIVALMKSKCPNASVDDIKSALYSSADDIGKKGKDVYTGYGRVNALKAVKAVNNLKTSMKKPTINTLKASDTYITGTASKGADIRVYNSKGSVIARGVASTSTGKYKIKIAKQTSGTTVKVVALKPGYYSKQATKIVSKAALKKFSSSLTAKSNIYSTTTKITGTGAKGATIRAYVKGKQIGKSTTVNSSGKYTLTIPKQKKKTVITIKMSKSGYSTKSITRTVK